MNSDVVDDVVGATVSVFQLEADPAPLSEAASSIDEHIARAAQDREQLLRQNPSVQIIDLTDAASSPDHGVSKIEEILALHRQAAAAEKPTYSFDLTDAASSDDGGTSLMQMATLQAAGVNVVAR